ncbi:MAG: hypothetical protein SPL30_03190 [Succinivibrio sp.]|jgi:flagellar biosynthesis/type III secretory pathway M-ring protein FliF/YscJ|nr:hypothetical protein [Succinivibrio sp.]
MGIFKKKPLKKAGAGAKSSARVPLKEAVREVAGNEPERTLAVLKDWLDEDLKQDNGPFGARGRH